MSGILRRLHQTLPKPQLFGLYGAVGGLLGALLLGEGLWAVLRPPPPRPSPPELQLAASASVEVYQGGGNRFVVKIARDRFTGPVALRFAGLPADVELQPATLPANQTELELPIAAARTAEPGSREFTVVGTGPAPEVPTAAEARVRLTVHKPPTPPPALRLAVSREVEIQQQGKSRFTVQIARDFFTGPVALRCEGLPAGTSVPETTIPADQTATDLDMTAAKDAAAGSREVLVTGTGDAAGTAVSGRGTFRLTVKPAGPPPVDVLFVLDVTGSMQWAIDGVRSGIRSFADALEAKRLDARVGLLAFRDHKSEKEEPEILTFNGEPFTADYDAFRRQVGRLRAGGGGDEPESSLDAVALGARQPFRREATKVLLLITDAPPHVPDKEMQSVAETTAVVRQHGIDQLHLVVRQQDLHWFKGLQQAANGQFFDLVASAQNEKAFAGILPDLSKAIARAALAARPKALAPTAAAPPVLGPPATAVKELPAPPAPPAALKGVQSNQEFAAGSSLQLLLAISVWTAAIAAGVCLALSAGQHYHLRQRWPALPEVGRALAVGLVAGLVGGAAGQFLFDLTAGTSAGEAVFRIIGWTLLGALAGLGVTFSVPNLRSDQGMMGGAMGGAAGAAAFLGVAFFLHGTLGGEVVGRICGAVLLGLGIGLMVAWAEWAFRTAWLEIRSGGRETLTVNLGPEPVSIGSDARACTIYARGAPAVAFRYWLKDGHITREEVATGKSQGMKPGEQQEVGAVIVTVSTASATNRTAAAPKPIRPPPPPPPVKLPPSPDLSRKPSPQPPTLPAPHQTAPAGPAIKPIPKPPPPPPPRGNAPAGAATGRCPVCGREASGIPGKRHCKACNQFF